MKSIRRRLLIALLTTISVALLLGAYATFRTARDEADTMFDYHLRQLALSLRDQVFENALPPGMAVEGEPQDFSIQVWSADGVRVYISHPRKALPDQARLGFATVQTDQGKWRVFATQEHGQTIQVAQPMRVRNSLALDAALRTVAPFLLLLPVLGLVIWVVVGRGLRPIGAVAQAVTTRTATALDPLPEGEAPAEVLPLVESLNDLLGRLKHALEAQRAFIADAAHELRTPLAALQLQAQLVERAQSEAERADALADLKSGLQRATHSVNQLLTLARQEPGAAERRLGPVDLAELAGQVLGELLPLAEAKAIDLGAAQPGGDAVVEGDGEGLRILISNLVGNAIRYTPRGGKVDVLAGDGPEGPFLEVVDTGPGIPAEERTRVFDRFYRRAESADTGTGLGLAIVETIADRHGASVILTDAPSGGLCARVLFPRRKV
jgi:two-component system, OmpR family, sensor kinase